MKLALLQYFRFRRQWLCVDEFRGADIIVDTGKEIIEVECKQTKSDLINGERKKIKKHQMYKWGKSFMMCHPNKFMLCVPLSMKDIAIAWCKDVNENYGIIVFDNELLKKRIDKVHSIWHCRYLTIIKSAKTLHSRYDSGQRWSIAKRTSAKIATLMEQLHNERIENRVCTDRPTTAEPEEPAQE